MKVKFSRIIIISIFFLQILVIEASLRDKLMPNTEVFALLKYELQAENPPLSEYELQEKVSTVGVENFVTIGDFFRLKTRSLKEVDLRVFKNTEKIGKSFLTYSNNEKKVIMKRKLSNALAVNNERF